jgi:outer membrane protein assembly factor BamB
MNFENSTRLMLMLTVLTFAVPLVGCRRTPEADARPLQPVIRRVSDAVLPWGPRKKPIRVWSFRLEAQGPVRIPIATAETVFSTDGRRVYAIDTKSGKQRWTLTTRKSPVSATPDGRLVFLADDHSMSAYHAASGREAWNWVPDPEYSAEPDQVIQAAATDEAVWIAGGGLAIGLRTYDGDGVTPLAKDLDAAALSADGEKVVVLGKYAVDCLNAATGDEIWSFNSGKYRETMDQLLDVAPLPPLRVDADVGRFRELKVSGTGHTVVKVCNRIWALGAGGELLWSAEIPAAGNIAWDEQTGVLCIQLPTRLIALEASSGRKLWEQPIRDQVVCLQSGRGILYTASAAEGAAAWDSRTGKRLWTLGSLPLGHAECRMTVGHGQFFIATPGMLVAITEHSGK